MLKPAEFLAKATINGKEVSFFTPPHDEPDFLWVDIEELARAFMPDEDAKRMVHHSHQLFEGERCVTTARNGDRIATVVSHAMAQGFCGFIDIMNGHDAENAEEPNGPAHWAYCIASGKVGAEHAPKCFDDLFAAFKNQGGPFMRHIRD